jgi:hypothetical protein
MFARGLVSLHAPPLLGRKPSSVKSRVSISSKLIETKGLQLHHFGHLRKTGGRGSYQLVYTALLPVPISLAAKSNYSRTYAIPGGEGLVIPTTTQEAGPPAACLRPPAASRQSGAAGCTINGYR